jgi:arabinoxylan arabinofuranohydrolase
MNRRWYLSAFFLLLIDTMPAQNPIVPAGVYMADPSAHVWQDGKIYIYASVDENPEYYCSHRHHVLSSADMKTWQLHENSFASRGPYDQVPYSDQVLYAPDCWFFNGIYYLYFCLADVKNIEGVATSPNPIGPFSNAVNINLYGYNQIDPCVFVDDDGQGYYIWGQFTAKMAKLKSNMVEIDKSTIQDKVLTESEHFFHEGGYLIKRNGIYYFIYAHMGRAAMPTCIGYATSLSPMGPYTYGGVIIDNDHCDPDNWNNHGSIVEFNGKWYVFYHRATHNSQMMRKACVEPITFNTDGTIPEVEMTSQGAGGPLDALNRIDAERACLLFGNVRIERFLHDNEQLGGIHNRDRVVYKYLDFGSGADSVTVCIMPGSSPGKIDLALDMPWKESIGTVELTGDVRNKEWKTVAAPVKRIAGIHALWLRFYGEGENLFAVDWIQFNKQYEKK